MGSVNPYLEQVLEAERKVAHQIQQAKEARIAKIRSAADIAEAEVAAFRQEEEQLFNKAVEERYGKTNEADAELETLSKKEIALVKRDYKENKDKVLEYLTQSTLAVKLSLLDVQKRYLQDAVSGKTAGYL